MRRKQSLIYTTYSQPNVSKGSQEPKRIQESRRPCETLFLHGEELLRQLPKPPQDGKHPLPALHWLKYICSHPQSTEVIHNMRTGHDTVTRNTFYMKTELVHIQTTQSHTSMQDIPQKNGVMVNTFLSSGHISASVQTPHKLCDTIPIYLEICSLFFWILKL
jgi:hypothetical protein